jgi:hypothetical protein
MRWFALSRSAAALSRAPSSVRGWLWSPVVLAAASPSLARPKGRFLPGIASVFAAFDLRRAMVVAKG